MVVGVSEKAAKPVTTVQNCVSTFVSVKLVDIFKEMSGKFLPVKSEFTAFFSVVQSVNTMYNVSLKTM